VSATPLPSSSPDPVEPLPPWVPEDEALEGWLDRLADQLGHEEWRSAHPEAHGAALVRVVTEDEMPDSVRAFESEEVDLELAEKAMAVLARAQRGIKQRDAEAEQWHAHIERWHQEATRRDRATVRWADGVLQAMLRRANMADPKVKSLTLPSGTVRSTGPAPGNEYVAEFTDEAAFIEWAKDHRPDLVRWKPDALISKVREGITVTPQGIVAVTADGEPVEEVPGVAVVRKERTFSTHPIV
jgi:hypothetical protein